MIKLNLSRLHSVEMLLNFEIIIKLIIFLVACAPLELSWVLDVSGTITEMNFEETKKFVYTIQAKIGIHESNKAAVTTFGDEGHRDISCHDHKNIEDFLGAIGSLKRRPKEFTNTRDGLEKGQESLITQGCGSNKKARKIIVLLTDGLANRGTGQEQGLIDASKYIQKNGTIILVVAVGQFKDDQLIKMVPSDNIHRTKAIKEGGFAALNNEQFVGDVKRAICGNVVPTIGINLSYSFLYIVIIYFTSYCNFLFCTEDVTIFQNWCYKTKNKLCHHKTNKEITK